MILRTDPSQGNIPATIRAPEDLRRTAFGFFNLISGLTRPPASALTGLLWDGVGPAFTFTLVSSFAYLPLLDCPTRGCVVSSVRNQRSSTTNRGDTYR